MKKRRAFSLVELLLTLALISIVILIATNLLLFGSKGHSITYDEFNIQSDLRIVSQKINTIIRDASGVFILHRTDDSNLTEEWNYLMLNEDRTKLVEYVWSSTTKTHEKRELAGSADGSSLDLSYGKDSAADEDKLIKFFLTLNLNDKSRNIDSELEAKNALQVIDRSYDKVGNTIAYRYDTRLDEVSNAQAVVSMVLDTSGSMGYTLTNGTAYDSYSNSNYHSRIKKMKAEAIRLVEKLAEKPNVNISTVRFSNSANNPKAMLNAKNNLSTIKNNINSLTANGGTNTGDGIRRGFYQIKDFNEELANINKTNKNFLIILVDGVTTYASVNKIVNETITSPIDHGNIMIVDGYRYERPSRNQSVSYTTSTYQGPTYTIGSNVYGYFGEKLSEKYWDRPQQGATKPGDTFIGKNGVTYTYLRYEWFLGNRYYYSYVNGYEYRMYNYQFNGIKREDYVTGDNNITESKANANSYYAGGRYAGNGSNLDPWGTEYVSIIGDMVKKYKEGTNEAIKVYVIGFSGVPADWGSLGDIAMATRGDDVYYEAGDSEALESIFMSIQRDISDALWHIGGPN